VEIQAIQKDYTTTGLPQPFELRNDKLKPNCRATAWLRKDGTARHREHSAAIQKI
jgi:hypothetical protein